MNQWLMNGVSGLERFSNASSVARWISIAAFASVAWAGAAISGSAWAESLNYNLVNLSVQAERDVPNDLMRVTLKASHQGDSPADVAESINQTMSWALGKAKSVTSVKSETQHYQTHPVYEKTKIRAWRGSQHLQLESKHFSELSELTRELQSKLAVSSMQFVPTRETRESVETGLINEAIAKFSQRAEQVQQQLKADDYDLVSMNVNTQGQRPTVNYRGAKMMAMDSAVESAPAVEAGTSVLTVNVNGQIQIK